MALKKQAFNVPLSQGVDTKSARLLAGVDGKLSTLENASFNLNGALIKRKGYDRLATTNLEGGSTSGSVGIHAFNNELLNTDGTYMRSYVGSQEHWRNVGRLHPVFSQTRWVVNSPFNQRNPTSCALNGLTFHAWEDESDGKVHAKLNDEDGNVIVNDVEISLGVRPHLTRFVDSAVLTYVSGTSLLVSRLTYYNLINQVFTNDYTITGISTDKNYACCTDSDSLVFAYSTTAGAAMGVLRLNTYFGLVYSTTISPLPCNGAISIHSDSTDHSVITSISSTDVVKVTVLKPDNTYITSAQTLSLNVQSAHSAFVSGTTQGDIERVSTIQRTATASGTGSYSLFTQSANKVHHALVQYMTGSAQTSGSLIIANDSFLISKPFTLNNCVSVGTVYSSSLQSTMFVVDDTGYVMGKAVNNNCSFRSSGTLNDAIVWSDGRVCLDIERFDRFATDEQETDIRAPGSTGVSEVTFSTGSIKSLKYLGSMHFPGSVMRSYDGGTIHETGFNTFPEVLSYNVVSGSGSIQPGTYTYAFTYQWPDITGRTHESAAIKTSVVVPGINSRVTFNVTSYGLTNKSDVALVGYRSNAPDEINPSLYRFTPDDSPTKSIQYSTSSTVVDTNGTDVINTNATLYTNGGELENISPPSSRDCVSFGNRFWTISSDDDSKLIFSKLVINSTRDAKPLEFSDLLSLNVPDEDNEGIVGLSALDDKLIIFKSSKMYYVIGEGPNNAGNGTFSVPKLFNVETGCDNPNSIVEVRDGIMFKSKTGIQLLNRGAGIEYIGADVEQYNDLNITSAVVVPASNQVRFLTDTNTALVYDYIQKQWCVWTNHESVGSVISSDGTYYRSLENGHVLTEATHYRDVDGFIKLKAETGWLPFAGINGYQLVSRVMFLGERKGSHKLKLSFAFDYVESFSNVQLIDTDDAIQGITFGSGLYGSGLFGSNPKANQYGVHIGRKCNSIKIRIEDTQPFTDSDDFNEGYNMSMVTFLVGIKDGLQRTESARNT